MCVIFFYQYLLQYIPKCRWTCGGASCDISKIEIYEVLESTDGVEWSIGPPHQSVVGVLLLWMQVRIPLLVNHIYFGDLDERKDTLEPFNT